MALEVVTRPAFCAAFGAHDPVIGDMRLLPAILANQVKGTLFASRPRYVREEYGPDVVKLVAEALSPEARRMFLEPPLAFAFAPYSTLLEIDYFIVQKAMGGMVDRMRHFGSKVASYDLPIAYRVLFKIGTPGFVVARLSTAYKTYLRPGGVEIRAASKDADLRLVGATMPRYMCDYGIPGWIRMAIELSGGSNVAVTQPTCVHRGGDSCRWDVTWR